MLDEGIAREVVNRVQKLRKKALLQPSDSVVVQFTVEPIGHDLSRVISEHKEYIEVATKNPMRSDAQPGDVLIVEEYELKGAKLTLVISKPKQAVKTRSGPCMAMKDYGKPIVPFVNVVCGPKCGVILLENPTGCNKIVTPQQLCEQVESLFGLSKAQLFYNPDCTSKVSAFQDLHGQTLYADAVDTFTPSKGSCCPFVNITLGDKSACLLLENPIGESLEAYAADGLKAVLSKSVESLNGIKLAEVNWKKAAGMNMKAM